MTESKKYITSKSKTFKEGTDANGIALWVLANVEKQFCSHEIKSKQKYKITITNLK